jgi:hypothetical protein
MSDGVLYRWDLTKNQFLPIASAPGCTFFTEPSPKLWIFGDATTLYRVKLTPLLSEAKRRILRVRGTRIRLFAPLRSGV